MKNNIDLMSALILLFIMTVMLSGCSRLENDSDNKLQNLTGSYTVKEIPFASNLAIGENESIHILDVKDANVLIEIEKTVKDANDPMGIETVYFADRLVIYNIEEEKITYERKMENEHACSSGILLEKGIAFIRMSMSKDSYGEYCLYYSYNGIETVVVSAAGTPDVFYDPQLIKLPDDNFAYTYYNPNSNEFGVNVVNSDFKVNQISKMISGSDWKFMRTSIYGNGDTYIYFYDQQGTGWFLIGDKSGVISQFKLADNERINNYCLLDDKVLLSMNMLDKTIQGKLILKNYKGQEISIRNQEPLYRMTSNNKDIVIATDSYFNNHIVRINKKDEITIQDLTVDDHLKADLEGALDGTAVDIRYSSGNKFILFFYGNEMKLLEVEVNKFI